ncbi:MAG: S1/P1 nuclease, partial [Bacteroidota bacterium]
KTTDMKKWLVILFFVPFCAFSHMIWGKIGHRVIGHLAEQHLTRKAKKEIAMLLEGQSLAFVATYADDIKSDMGFAAYGPWHYVNYPMNATYAESSKSPSGDVVQAILQCQSILENPSTSKKDKAFHLKLLVHFMGDLHQPLHVGRAEDRGGNDIKLQWFGTPSNLHRLWDTNLLEHYGMSYSELSEALNLQTDRKTRRKLQQGSIISWADESHAVAKTVYASAKEGDQLGYVYAYQYKELLLEHLKKGGLRLAKVLNEIFG